MWFFSNRLFLYTFKLTVTKAKFRKSGSKLYFENSALCTFDLWYSLNGKGKTILVKLQTFRWFAIRNIHILRSHFWYWFCLSPSPLPFWIHNIICFDIFLMIQYKLYLEMWKNDTEEQCCQRKTPACDKTKFYFILSYFWKPRKIVKIVSV